MTRELLGEMLDGREEVDGGAGAYTADESVGLELLLSSQSGGPATVRRVAALQLEANFLTVEADEQSWCLAYDDIMGIRLKPRRKETRTRTGFLS
jgi:hypothetical protein